MSDANANDHDEQQKKRQRKALMKPFEVVVIAAASGLFTLLVVLLTVKDFGLGLIFAGIAMVAVFVVMGLLLLNYKPNPDVPVYLDRHLYDSDEPGAKGAAWRPYDGIVEAEEAAADAEAGDAPKPEKPES
ncbi:hypothetical protein [Gulosibacter faecalis]|uniref:ABC transporter ATP-binding protein n=1 Tax=Gulosibacter faecalis TaxID=272240 RepID=A0ABW5UVY5_9MICO|nr:hypothetical protein [Gulosibacter faecalis]